MKRLLALLLSLLVLAMPASASAGFWDAVPDLGNPDDPNNPYNDDCFDRTTKQWMHGLTGKPNRLWVNERDRSRRVWVKIDDRPDVCFPDAQPTIENDRTLLPVRFVAQELGFQVDWDADKQEVTIAKPGTTIVLKVNDRFPTVNGVTREIDAPARIHFGRTYVPVRFVSETMGLKVGWDAPNLTVKISTK